MKTLGICIPTYKRPEFLKRCVLSAVASAEGRPLAVYIADDSMDSTNEAVIAGLQAEYPFVNAHRNVKNLGIDANIQHAVDLCDRDFAWLIGEDDTFLPGAVARIFDQLQEFEGDFLFSNYALVRNDPRDVLGKALEATPSGLMPAATFFEDHLYAAGFIGACVIRRAAWSRTDPAPYLGTYYAHVGRIAEIVADAGTVRIDAECAVANRVQGGDDTFTWKLDSYGVFFGFIAMCRTAGERRPAYAKALHHAGETLQRRYRLLSLGIASRLRAEGAYDYRQYRKYIAGHAMPRSRKLALMAASLTPPALLKPLVRLYRYLWR